MHVDRHLLTVAAGVTRGGGEEDAARGSGGINKEQLLRSQTKRLDLASPAEQDKNAILSERLQRPSRKVSRMGGV